MMVARYSVSEVIDLLFDDDFCLSDGDLSDEEGDGLYAYLGDRSLSREAVEYLSRELDENQKLVQKVTMYLLYYTASVFCINAMCIISLHYQLIFLFLCCCFCLEGLDYRIIFIV